MTAHRVYDEDIYTWSEQQAAALRRLAPRLSALSNDLDLEHVAEEIEDVGKSERDVAESYLRLILARLLKASAAPGASAIRHWRSEIVAFHIGLRIKLSPAMRGRIDLDDVWRLARKQALAQLDADQIDPGGSAMWDVDTCPVSLDRLASPDLDIDAALASLSSVS